MTRALAATALPATAFAGLAVAHPAGPCDDHVGIVAHLEKEYGELPVVLALNASGVMLDVGGIRDAALSAKDTELFRTVEMDDAAAQTRIAAEDQARRDIPQTFDLASAASPEDLKSLWPAELA